MRVGTSGPCVVWTVCYGAILVVGCADRPPAVDLPSVDAGEAASFAMEHYDTNDDGAVEANELESCPPLAIALASYDADGNSKLSAEEIERRLANLYGPGAALTGVDCTVSQSGRPLPGATVKFRPVEMLAQSIRPGQGLTDASGFARISLGDEDLPDDLKGTPLMPPGLYHVEITHPQVAIPASYNTATTLGFEVDPAQRGGTSARFDLTAK